MSTTSKGAELALNELKKQAKRLGKDAERGEPAARARLGANTEPQHKHLLAIVAREAGFRDWQHAHRILSGRGRPGDDFGTVWHGRPSGGFLNEWHARYQDARASWLEQPGTFLLPYKTQFMIVGHDLMRHLGLPEGTLLEGRDLTADQGWDELYRLRLRAVFAAK